MLQLNKKEKLFNLKGIAVSPRHNPKTMHLLRSNHSFIHTSSFLYIQFQLGNPLLEFATDYNSRAEFFWSHGVISDSTYRMFTSVCNYSRYVSEYARGPVSPVCSEVMGQVARETSKFVDNYDVTLDVCISSVLSQSKRLGPQVILFHHVFTIRYITAVFLLRFTVSNCSELPRR